MHLCVILIIAASHIICTALTNERELLSGACLLSIFKAASGPITVFMKPLVEDSDSNHV